MINLNCIETNGTAITDLVFSPTGSILAVSFGQTVLLVEIESCRILHRLDTNQPVAAITFAPDGSQLAAAGDDGLIHLYDTADGRLQVTATSEQGGYYTVAWSPDGRFLAAGHYDPVVELFDPSTGQSQHTLDPDVFDDEGRTCVRFSPDSRLLVSTAYNSLFLWQLPVDELTSKTRFRRRKMGVRGYAHLIDASFAPDGRSIAALARIEDRSDLHIWEADTGKSIGHIQLPHQALRLVWSPNQELLAVAELFGDGVSLWEPTTLARLSLVLHGAADEDTVLALAINPGGDLIVAGTEGGAVIGWNLATGQKM
jgi:WD40 repeat protein